MKLSTRSRYGVRIIMDLSIHSSHAPVRMQDIAMRQGISMKYIEQLIIPLKKAGYVTSIRGPKGGYRLNKSPEKIAMGEIVNILEGGLTLSECLEKPEKCDRYENCLTRHIWEKATKAMLSELNSVSLAEMMHSTDYEKVSKKDINCIMP